MMDKNSRKEILFYYESQQNPNGDPGFENQPRVMSDDTIIVTDVRIKRTIRDYAKNMLGKTIFVDYGKDGNPVKASTRAKELVPKGDTIKGLLVETFDTPLFGALVPMAKDNEAGDSEKLAGPCQFGIGRSINKVKVINPTIVGRFVGKEKAGKEKQHSTIGKFYSVEYALIRIQGMINPVNLDKYLEDKEVVSKFNEAEGNLFDCLWNGTNNLSTRSKYPQRSILYIEVEYDRVVYNDLPVHVDEEASEGARSLKDCTIGLDGLARVLCARKDRIVNVRVAGCEELGGSVKEFASKLDSCKIKVEEIKWDSK